MRYLGGVVLVLVLLTSVSYGSVTTYNHMPSILDAYSLGDRIRETAICARLLADIARFERQPSALQTHSSIRWFQNPDAPHTDFENIKAGLRKWKNSTEKLSALMHDKRIDESYIYSIFRLHRGLRPIIESIGRRIETKDLPIAGKGSSDLDEISISTVYRELNIQLAANRGEALSNIVDSFNALLSGHGDYLIRENDGMENGWVSYFDSVNRHVSHNYNHGFSFYQMAAEVFLLRFIIRNDLITDLNMQWNRAWSEGDFEGLIKIMRIARSLICTFPDQAAVFLPGLFQLTRHQDTRIQNLALESLILADFSWRFPIEREQPWNNQGWQWYADSASFRRLPADVRGQIKGEVSTSLVPPLREVAQSLNLIYIGSADKMGLQTLDQLRRVWQSLHWGENPFHIYRDAFAKWAEAEIPTLRKDYSDVETSFLRRLLVWEQSGLTQSVKTLYPKTPPSVDPEWSSAYQAAQSRGGSEQVSRMDQYSRAFKSLQTIVGNVIVPRQNFLSIWDELESGSTGVHD